MGRRRSVIYGSDRVGIGRNAKRRISLVARTVQQFITLLAVWSNERLVQRIDQSQNGRISVADWDEVERVWG